MTIMFMRLRSFVERLDPIIMLALALGGPAAFALAVIPDLSILTRVVLVFIIIVMSANVWLRITIIHLHEDERMFESLGAAYRKALDANHAHIDALQRQVAVLEQHVEVQDAIIAMSKHAP